MTTQADGQQQAQGGAQGSAQTTDTGAGASKETGKSTQGQQQAATTQQGDKSAQTDTSAGNADVELKLPEGFKPDAEALGDFKKLAKDLGMKSEQAQKLFDWNLAVQKKTQEAAAKEWEQTKTAWVEELKADAEFGGKNFDSNMDAANKVAARVGEPFVKLLADTGLGNHPVMVKALSFLGKATADDKMNRGGTTQQHEGPPTLESAINTVFPNSGAQMLKDHPRRST